MENLVEKLRNEAVKINSYKNSEFEYSEFVSELCQFLHNLNELMTVDIEETLSILWYFVHEKTFEDKNLSKHKILSEMDDEICKDKFIEFYHMLGKVYEAIEKLENN